MIADCSQPPTSAPVPPLTVWWGAVMLAGLGLFTTNPWLTAVAVLFVPGLVLWVAGYVR